MLAPPKTPADIVAKVNADLQKVLALPEVQAKFEAFGVEVVGSSGDVAVSSLRADAQRWARLVKERQSPPGLEYSAPVVSIGLRFGVSAPDAFAFAYRDKITIA